MFPLINKRETGVNLRRIMDMRGVTPKDVQEYICRAASLRAGGVGMRYTCIIDGKESHLYYEDNNMWFVEGR